MHRGLFVSERISHGEVTAEEAGVPPVLVRRSRAVTVHFREKVEMMIEGRRDTGTALARRVNR